MRPSLILSHYQHQLAYYLDLVALIPVEYVYPLFHAHFAAPVLTVLSLLPNGYLTHLIYFSLLKPGVTLSALRMIRLFKCHALSSGSYVLEKAVGRRYGRLISLAVTVAFISHLVACIYWILGRLQGFGVTTFYPDAGIVNRDPQTRYLLSLYTALNLVSGVGDTPSPDTDPEIIFVLLVRIAGMSIYASIIGNVGALLSERDPSTVLFEDKVNSVRLFMKYHRLPLDLEKRVLNHYKLLWERQKGMREMEVLNDLPSALRSEVTLLLNADVLCKVCFSIG